MQVTKLVMMMAIMKLIFFSSRRRHTRYWRDWSSDVCSSDLNPLRDLDKQNSLSPKEQKLLSLALNSARNLYHFTTELLDFQKMDVHTSDGRKMKMGLYDLKAYLTEITESCASLFEEKDIRTRLIVPKEEVRVWMNREKVDHVLYNVISNAVKYNK